MSTHRLVNARGDEVVLLNHGARIVSIRLQLESGPREVVLQYARLEDVRADPYYIGATVGRYCNRIRDARFVLDGRVVEVAANDGRHHLHGGPEGFWQRTWHAGGGASERNVEFCLRSPDGDQGFPGNVDACVRFEWSDDRELKVHYAASTDSPTHINLTNHTYFDLGGGKHDVLLHRIAIDADSYTVTDDEMLPTGEIRPVAGSVLDLRAARPVHEIVESADPRVRVARGADFNYVLSGDDVAAVLWSPGGDLAMHVRTTCPGLQFYSGQFLSSPFRPHAGLCLETQYFPDTPNQPGFPSTRLAPGQIYSETTAYRFTAA